MLSLKLTVHSLAHMSDRLLCTDILLTTDLSILKYIYFFSSNTFNQP